MKADDEPNLMGDATIQEIAASKGVSSPQVLLAWHVNRNSCVIPKSVTPTHMKSNLDAEEIELSPSEMETIGQLDRAYRFVNGTFFEMPGSGYSDIFDQRL